MLANIDMGTLTCPLCCEDEFTDQLTLRYHLLSMIENVYCPQCSQRFDTILQLAKHLDGMCGSTGNDKDSLQLESSCNKENINMDYCKQKLDTDLDNLKILNHENLKEKDTDEGQQVEFLVIAMDSSTTDASDFLNTSSYSQVIEHSEGSTCFSPEDLKDVEKRSHDMEIDSLLLCDNSNVKNADFEEPQKYACSVCDVTVTSISEHIKLFHGGQEVEIKGMNNKAVDVSSSGIADRNLACVEERNSNENSAVHFNTNERNFAESRTNTAVCHHKSKNQQSFPYLTSHKFEKKELGMRRKCGKNVSFIISGGLKSELKIERVVKNDESNLVKKNTDVLSELTKTIIKSPEMKEEELSPRKKFTNNTISVFQCTFCQMEFGNLSIFKKHSCAWRSKLHTGMKFMKTVDLKPETFHILTNNTPETEENDKLELVVQVVKCRLCSLTFKKLGAYREHLKSHNITDHKRFTCPHCRAVCSSNINFAKHLKRHLINKSGQC